MKVTNISKGARGINTKAGTVLLEPGETRDDLEVVDDELAVAKSTGWFDISGKAAADEKK